jgi:YHS domain-containing protein
MEIDPVCGMEVDPGDAAGEFEYGDLVYYFCSEACLQEFTDDPESYIE